jgi:hypothetical protein
VTTFSHTIASASPLEACETGLFSVSTGEQAVSRRILNSLIPCNLRKRRLLRHSDLYRGFESLSLRHAVWDAEKVGSSTSEIRENCPYFAIVPGQTGPQRTDCSAAKASLFGLFSGGHMRSPVSRRALGECNAITCLGLRKRLNKRHWMI